MKPEELIEKLIYMINDAEKAGIEACEKVLKREWPNDSLDQRIEDATTEKYVYESGTLKSDIRALIEELKMEKGG